MITLKRLLLALVIVGAIGAIASAEPITLYWEDFEVGAPNSPLSAAGWQGVSSNGTGYQRLTDLTVDPSRIVAADDLEGQYRTWQGHGANWSQWLFTHEPDFSLNVWSDLTVSFMHRDEGSGHYRLALKVDDEWYLQDDSIAASTSTTTSTLAIDSTDFILWSDAPSNDQSAWTIPPQGDGSTFPSTGRVTGFGMMLLKDHSTNNRFRFDAIEITGIPEPCSAVMLLAGVAGLVLMRRRRKE